VDTSEARVLYTILASLPYLHIHAGEPADHPSHVYVNNIAQLCENKQLVNLSKWFKTFQRKRVFSEDTLKQLVLAIKEAFFPTYEVAVLQFLLDLVDFGPANYKRPVLVILRAAVTSIGLSSSSSSSVNHDDLIGPVFRLLNSEFVEEALLILDHTVSIASSGKASMYHIVLLLFLPIFLNNTNNKFVVRTLPPRLQQYRPQSASSRPQQEERPRRRKTCGPAAVPGG